MDTLNAELSKINILDNKIIFFDNYNEIVIPKENNSRFIYKDKKYTHKIIFEVQLFQR